MSWGDAVAAGLKNGLFYGVVGIAAVHFTRGGIPPERAVGALLFTVVVLTLFYRARPFLIRVLANRSSS